MPLDLIRSDLEAAMQKQTQLEYAVTQIVQQLLHRYFPGVIPSPTLRKRANLRLVKKAPETDHDSLIPE
ncbi:MAG: hypothetical protein ACLQAT_13575 [Candidatus Binataceae bacterium]